MKQNFGEYGGKVQRNIQTSNGVIEKGTILKPEDIEQWPLQNRIALAQSGKVLWYGPPSDGEVTARTQGAPAPRRRPTTVPTQPATPARGRRAR